jgi:hypothetical protein
VERRILVPECAGEVVFWDDAVEDGEIKEDLHCPQCNATITKRSLDRKTVVAFNPETNASVTRAKRKPVLINYTVGDNRYEKAPDKSDLALIERIEKTPCPHWYPTNQHLSRIPTCGWSVTTAALVF